MELKGIKEFLERYKATLLRSSLSREEISQTIFEITGVKLKDSDFKIEHNEITLLVSSIKKNQIYLYKQRIIDSLKNSNNKTISDIH